MKKQIEAAFESACDEITTKKCLTKKLMNLDTDLVQGCIQKTLCLHVKGSMTPDTSLKSSRNSMEEVMIFILTLKRTKTNSDGNILVTWPTDR